MRFWFAIVFACAFAGGLSTAHSEVVTVCGASKGYSFFFPGHLVPNDQSGWHEDQVSPGKIILTVEGDNIDVIFSDAQGTKSAHSQGGIVKFMPGSADGFFGIMVFYSAGAMEHYIFQIDKTGKGVVAWGTSRYGGVIQKSTLFTAACDAQ